MLLTRSFFNPALLRSDLRRCWPLFAGYTFLWFLILPLRMWNDVSASVQAAHPEQARRIALEIIGDAATAAIWIHLIFGIVLAMALFSYLSSARATCGMHSFPAGRGCQFRTHVLCGIGCVAVSNVLICLLSAQSGGTHWGASLSWLVFSLVTFLLFFALGIVCCMLCGWLPAMIVAYGAVNCVAILCRILVDALCNLFYPSYNDTLLSMGQDNIVVWLTPVMRLRLCMTAMYGEGNAPLLPASAWKSLLVYGIVAVVLLAASALLYSIRRSEASGDTLAFRPLRPVVRWGVGLLGGLGLGVVLALVLNCTGNTVALLACVIVLGLVCMIGTQMLIARTPRIFGKLWPELLALCAALMALCLCIKGDLFGFQQRVPQADQVESATIYSGFLTCNATTFTDASEIDAVLQAHRYFADRAAQEGRDAAGYGRNLIITYALKNGGTLSRQYDLRSEDLSQVKKLVDTDTFRHSLVLDGIASSSDKLRYGWVNIPSADVSRELAAQQCRTLYEAVLEDIANLDMTDPALYQNQNCLLQIDLEDTGLDRDISVYLNRQCTRTLALLQQWGIIQTPEAAFGAADDYAGVQVGDTIEYPGFGFVAPYTN